MNRLPQRTEEYLARGSTKGNRNAELFDAAAQFRDARYAESEARNQLMPRAIADGLSNSEAAKTIHSAFAQAPRDPIGGNGGSHPLPQPHPGPIYRKVPLRSAPLPVPLNGQSAVTFLETVFRSGEFVSIAKAREIKGTDGKLSIAPEAGEVRQRETWMADIQTRGTDAVFDCVNGLFVRINPLRDATGKSDKDVAVYRHILVESDEGAKEDQLAALKAIGLPLSVITDSGNRSIHGLVIVDAPDEKTYRERFEVLREYCEQAFGLKIDAKNKNPSRFSRFPGAKRIRRDEDANPILDADGERIIDRQTLLECNVAGKPWDEWQRSLPVDDGLPEDGDLCEFMSVQIPEPPHLLRGLLRKGQVMIVSGASKTYKSWTAMEIALSISQGGRFAKWQAIVGKVFYIDTELEEFDFQMRMRSIMTGAHYDPDPGDFRKLLLRGTKTEIRALVDSLAGRLSGKHYDLIVIDAIYSLLGDREENSNEDITQIGIELFRLAKLTGAAVLFIHHFSKGSQQGKRGIEKASGAGAWGRFPDVSLAIDQHPEDFCYNFESDSRTFPPDKPFVVKRINGIWQVQIEKRTETKGGINLTEFLHLLAKEGQGKLSPKNWKDLCTETLGFKNRKAFDARRDLAIQQGLITSEGSSRNLIYHFCDQVRFDSEINRYVRGAE